jgi:tagatose 6-phosphate kinase
MVLVINLNASLDKIYTVSDFKKGTVMRTDSVENTPGGKGMHVANILTILHEPCTVTGFLGGKTGELIINKLEKYGIQHDFITIKAETRSCIAVVTPDGKQTEILETGPMISPADQDYFMQVYQKFLDKADIVVASGSLPGNMPVYFYRVLVYIANKCGKLFILDTSGEALRLAIEAKPFFIKPNQDEIEWLTGHSIAFVDDAVKEIKMFLQKGIQLPVISLGENGSIAGYAGKIYQVNSPKLNVVNAVGSGDSYVAGIAIGLQRKYDIVEVLRLASACGAANVLEKESGFVNLQTVKDLLETIQVKELSTYIS